MAGSAGPATGYEFQRDRDRDSDPFADAFSAAGGVLSSVFGPATSAASAALRTNPIDVMKGRLCCCTAPDDRGKAFETNDSAFVSSVVGEDPIGLAIFPTILKQKDAASKQSTPSHTPTCRSPTGGRSPTGRFGGSSPGSPKWAPGGVLASLMANNAGGSADDLVEYPEVDIEGGARYKGQWLGEERHGRGVLIAPEGVKYEGQFRNGMAHGRGTFLESDGSKYEGQWHQDTKHGHGTYVHADGTTYEGQWQEDCKSGTGTESWEDGASYQGEFKFGFKHGVGIYRGNGVEYEGQFREDKMEGEGCYKFVGGRKYFGQWEAGHMSGLGRMEWPNGSLYEGGYQNDMKHGEGTFVWPDGRRYAGEWQAGKQHGKGVSEDGQGFRSQDVWQQGELVSSSRLPAPGSQEDDNSDLEEH